jgi:murein DD-endopeptidase MepM/ murein hydrolase activator NlpD
VQDPQSVFRLHEVADRSRGHRGRATERGCPYFAWLRQHGLDEAEIEPLNIIIVSGSLGSGKTIALNGYQFGGLLLVFSLAVMLLVTGVQAAMSRFGAGHAVFGEHAEAPAGEGQAVLRESIDMMATRLGEMQARLLRLDTLGERLARSAGFKPQEFMFDQVPGRGGAVPGAGAAIPRGLSVGELGQKLDLLSRQVDDRAERLGIIESIVSMDFARRTFVPSALPVVTGQFSSNFGWRIDPFTGRNAFHDGVDFFAEPGAPIVAAASGVVTVAEFHPQYGNMVDIDHGNDLVTRYAHASVLHVRVGDVVRRGHRIADVGSTGRSTGPHLHFEVRHRGLAQTPNRVLKTTG